MTERKNKEVAGLELYNPPSQTLSVPYRGGPLVPYKITLQNMFFFPVNIFQVFMRVSILYFKPFVFP